jgi:formylglycine-generating enzyme required for sulfatase activity
VRKLHRYLKQHGIEPWLDREELLPGQNWEVEISKALDASDAILVCLSKTSISKEGFVQKEISFALDKALEKPEGMIFIIPVKLEDCDLPRNLNRYQAVDLFREGGRKRLLMGLNRRATELGEDVSPVLMEDTKQRTLKPFKPEIKQEEPVDLTPLKDNSKAESKQETPADLFVRKEEAKQEHSAPELKKEMEEEKPLIKPALIVEKKPFTKVLDPSSLAAYRAASKTRDQKAKKPVPTYSYRWILMGLTVLIIVILSAQLLPASTENATSSPTSPNLVTVEPSSTHLNSSQTPSPDVTQGVLTATRPPTSTPITPTPNIGSTMISEKDSMVLVYVPAGKFIMGSGDGGSDEKPIHTVDLDAFWIDKTEVTNAMYAKCVDAGKCDSPSIAAFMNNSSYADHPVVYIDWSKANAYCFWANRRLPTEAEWEKAARGTNAGIYPWGEDDISCTRANYSFGCVGGTREVGSYQSGKSAYGIYDMAGNVWEWVSSLYQPYPYDADDGRENLSSSASRVLRGGSWYVSDAFARSASRFASDGGRTSNFVGFRCARSP